MEECAHALQATITSVADVRVNVAMRTFIRKGSRNSQFKVRTWSNISSHCEMDSSASVSFMLQVVNGGTFTVKNGGTFELMVRFTPKEVRSSE